MGMAAGAYRFRAGQRRAFGLVDSGMLGRGVAEPAVEEAGPYKAHRAEEKEAVAPRHEVERDDDDQRREGAAPPRRQPHDRLRARPVFAREPVAEGLGEVREGAGFADAEQEPDRRQRPESHRKAGGHREGRPPDHDSRQHRARPDSVSEPAPGHFEDRVGQAEHHHDDAHLLLGQPEFGADLGLRLRDAHAIQIQDHGQGDGVPQQGAAGTGRRFRSRSHGPHNAVRLV